MKDKLIKYNYILAILGYSLTIICYVNKQELFGFSSLFIGGILLRISSVFMLVASALKLSKEKKIKQR